jgi:hypothetical protein
MADPVDLTRMGKRGLEWLGVLIGRAQMGRSVVGERMFLVVGPQRQPRVPQDMIETRPLPLMR